MSRFDDELIKQAESAFVQRGLSGKTTEMRQLPHINNVQPFDGALVPAAVDVVEQVGNASFNRPVNKLIQVTDLNAADPQGGKPGEIVGQPGMSQVYSLGGPDPVTQPGALTQSTGFGGNIQGLPAGSLGALPKAASIDPIDESLYQVYKASREIRDAINTEVDFDFGNLFTAATEASTVLRFASSDDDIKSVIGTVASIVADIENDLATTGNFKQASSDLASLESLLEEINKVAKKKDCKHCEGKGCEHCEDEKEDKTAAKKDCKHCKGKGCDKCKKAKGKSKDEDEEDDDDDDKPAFLKKKATNGNQETGVTVDVRDLDDQAGEFSRLKAMTPDFTTNVLEGEQLNAEDAGYFPDYNDGSETGIVPGQEPHKSEVFPYDGTNPAMVPYQNALGAVQASREKIFDALQVVERLEKLGMAHEDERAKNLAIFEQMSDAKLAGVKAGIDLFEESGARQPRSQKVASNTNRLPEMGRLTTASTVSRQQLSADDWLMTL